MSNGQGENAHTIETQPPTEPAKAWIAESLTVELIFGYFACRGQGQSWLLYELCGALAGLVLLASCRIAAVVNKDERYGTIR